MFLQQLPYYAVHLFCSCHSVTRHLLASTGTVLLVSVAYIKSLFCCFCITVYACQKLLYVSTETYITKKTNSCLCTSSICTCQGLDIPCNFTLFLEHWNSLVQWKSNYRLLHEIQLSSMCPKHM